MLRKPGNILLLILMVLPLYGSVELIAPQKITEGDDVVFKIVAKGFEIKFPQIDFIEGCVVQETNSESEAYLLNTLKASKVTKSYKLVTKNTLKIPSFSLKINGKVEHTKAQEIKVQMMHKTVSNNYDLQMQLSKSQAYVDEELILKVIFSYKDVEDYDVRTPSFENFSIEELDTKSYKAKNDTYFQEIRYKLRPLKVGDFSLSGCKADVQILKKSYAHQNNLSRYIDKISVYSNALRLNVLPLPKNISIVGSYEIRSVVFNKKVKLNQPVKVRLIVSGMGNINDLDAFTFEIPSATVYDKGTVKEKKENMDYFTKDFEILSQEDFQLPSFSLSYFDTITQSVKHLKTSSYFIKVIGGKKTSQRRETQTIKIEKIAKMERLSMIEKIIYFIMGVVAAIAVAFIYQWIKKLSTVKKESSLIQELKKIQTQEAFFKKVVPLIGKHHSLDNLIFALEQEDKRAFKKLKKELINFLTA